MEALLMAGRRLFRMMFYFTWDLPPVMEGHNI